MKKRTLFGLVASTMWISAFGVLLYMKRHTLHELPVNAWGDFVAGAVAPLTFFWLILGYLQQGDELEQNTAALLAQQRELENQVRETAALVQNAERQAKASESLAAATQQEAERQKASALAASAPNFTAQGGRGSNDVGVIEIINEGASVKRLLVVAPQAVELLLQPSDYFPSKGKGTLTFRHVTSYPFTFDIQFTDLEDRMRKQRYEMVSPFTLARVNEA